jgi:NADH dehydrogenase (ubiquinone) Fe-S protein 1
VYNLASKSKIINQAEKWNGINILHNEASRVGSLDIGITPKKSISKKAKVVYLLGADNFRHEEIPEDAFVIY